MKGRSELKVFLIQQRWKVGICLGIVIWTGQGGGAYYMWLCRSVEEGGSFQPPDIDSLLFSFHLHSKISCRVDDEP